jgi:hypothetical protein
MLCIAVEQTLTKQNIEALTVLVDHGIHPKKKKGRTSKVTPIVHLPAWIYCHCSWFLGANSFLVAVNFHSFKVYQEVIHLDQSWSWDMSSTSSRVSDSVSAGLKLSVGPLSELSCSINTRWSRPSREQICLLDRAKHHAVVGVAQQLVVGCARWWLAEIVVFGIWFLFGVVLSCSSC